MKEEDKSGADYDLYKSLKNLSEQLNREGYSLSHDDLEDLKKQISFELSQHKSYKELQTNSEKIVNYLSEYFDTFVLLGYDSKGERVTLQFCDTQLKQDALYKLIEQTFVKNMQKFRPPGELDGEI